MPKTPIDYSKCEMYQIVCKDEELDYMYVGHTTNWTKRKNKHKSDALTSERKLYQTIRENGGWDNFKMLQIESFPCNNRREAEAREDKLMTELKANMNHYRACRSKQQYHEENKEQIHERRKQHYEANREQILERQKQHHQANKEQINERKKQHYEANKERNNARRRKRYEANKDRINAKRRELYQAKKE